MTFRRLSVSHTEHVASCWWVVRDRDDARTIFKYPAALSNNPQAHCFYATVSPAVRAKQDAPLGRPLFLKGVFMSPIPKRLRQALKLRMRATVALYDAVAFNNIDLVIHHAKRVVDLTRLITTREWPNQQLGFDPIAMGC